MTSSSGGASALACQVFALAVAQPEHAGLGVGRIGYRGGGGVFFATVDRCAGDFALKPVARSNRARTTLASATTRPLRTASAKSGWVAIQFWMVRRVTPKKSAKTSLVAPTRQ